MKRALITISVDVDELWSTVFGSGFDTWQWWHEVEYIEGASWDSAGPDGEGLARLTIEHPEQDNATLTKVISVEALVAAWNLAVQQCATLSGKALNHEDLDAADADAVLQIAIFGKTVYA